MARIHHKESDIQIRIVKFFRVTYPDFAYLMFHPHNEGNAFTRQQQIIANREGVTKGVSDLVFLIPTLHYHFLTIEVKNGTKGRQSEEQKLFQRYVEAIGGKYVVARTYEGAVDFITRYMDDVTPLDWGAVGAVTKAIEKERTAEAQRELQKLMNKNIENSEISKSL